MRVFSREPVEGYRPPTLAGHRDTVVGVYFAEGGCDLTVAPAAAATLATPPGALYTVSRDGALFRWEFDPGPRLINLVTVQRRRRLLRVDVLGPVDVSNRHH